MYLRVCFFVYLVPECDWRCKSFWRETFIKLIFSVDLTKNLISILFSWKETPRRYITYSYSYVVTFLQFHVLWYAQIGLSSYTVILQNWWFFWGIGGWLFFTETSKLFSALGRLSVLCSCRFLPFLPTSDLFKCLPHYSKAVRRADVMCGFLVDWHGKQINSAVLTSWMLRLWSFGVWRQVVWSTGTIRRNLVPPFSG
jgi:hypothetical protein